MKAVHQIETGLQMEAKLGAKAGDRIKPGHGMKRSGAKESGMQAGG